MNTFSERYGYAPKKPLQVEVVERTLVNRIWNYFRAAEYDGVVIRLKLENKRGITEEILEELGKYVCNPNQGNGYIVNQKRLHDLIIKLDNKKEWYVLYDFIEAYLSVKKPEEARQIADDINHILERENSGYRIHSILKDKKPTYQILPLTNKEEMESVTEAGSTPYDSVNIHLGKSIDFYSDRKSPDYENSIKESISAVEAACKIITQDDKADLSKALKQFDKSGSYIHPALKEALIKLYAYTSDAGAIRHANIEFREATEAEARFVLVTCSAFINYLISTNPQEK